MHLATLFGQWKGKHVAILSAYAFAARGEDGLSARRAIQSCSFMYNYQSYIEESHRVVIYAKLVEHAKRERQINGEREKTKRITFKAHVGINVKLSFRDDVN